MKRYNLEVKEQISKEVKETGNVAILAKRHEITPSNIHTWIKKDKDKQYFSQKDCKTVGARASQ